MGNDHDQPLAQSIAATVIPGLLDAEWRDSFADHVRQLTFRRMRAAAAAYGVVLLFFIALAWGFAGRAFVPFALHYASFLGFLLIMLALSLVRALERYAFVLSVILALGTAIFIVLPALRFEDERPVDAVSLVLLLLCTALLFPYTRRRMLGVSASILALFSGASALVLDPAEVSYVIEGIYLVGSATILATVGAHLSHRLREQEYRGRRELEAEREKAERLLLNILPASIVKRLQRDRAAIADGFAEATVLFADIVDFTPLCTEVAPPALVEMLNGLFSEFDKLTERYGLEKIKTIGDAYMVAGGLPTPREDHAQAVAEMALEMRKIARRSRTPLGERLRIRIGINTGPVVAGVIGTKKFIYDLWGDTVNTAARMETHGQPDAIQVTEATYRQLRDRFELQPRGPIAIKGKGEMRTYLLRGHRRG